MEGFTRPFDFQGGLKVNGMDVLTAAPGGGTNATIADGSVTTLKLADNAVTRAKLSAALRTELDGLSTTLGGKQDSLPSGANGQFLSLVSGAPAWVAAPSGGGTTTAVVNYTRAAWLGGGDPRLGEPYSFPRRQYRTPRGTRHSRCLGRARRIPQTSH